MNSLRLYAISLVIILLSTQSAIALEQADSYALADQTYTAAINETIDGYCKKNMAAIGALKTGVDCLVQIKTDCTDKKCEVLTSIESQEKIIIANRLSMKSMGVKPIEEMKKDPISAPKVISRQIGQVHIGSPDLDTYDDLRLIRNENKIKDLPILRAKFKELKDEQNSIASTELQLQCSTKSDCELVPVGNKLCGGAASFLIVSKLDKNYFVLKARLEKLTKLDRDLQQILHGFASTCELEVGPKPDCVANMCKS